MVAQNDTTEKQRAEQIVRRRDSLKSDRGTLDSHAQEVAEYVVPRKSYVTVRRQEGQKTITFNTELFDATAVFANQNMSAGLVSHLAPANSRWFAIKAKDEELNKNDAVKASLAKITTLLHEELGVSNFYMQLSELTLDLGWAGMGCMEPMEGKTTSLNFKTHHLSEFHIAESSDQIVDTVYYTFKYTARQAMQEWGREDNGEIKKDLSHMGESVVKAWKSSEGKDRDNKFEFIQELKPREEFDRFPAAPSRRAIASTFVAVKDKVIVAEDGFFEMPKLTPRWLKNTNEVNGRSQGMFGLPWIKLLNTTWKNMTQAVELGMRPPVLVPDNGFIGPVRSVPGAIWSYRSGLAANVNAIRFLDTKANTRDGMKYIEYLTQLIQKAFYNDLFVMLQQQTKTQTAFEIAQRVEEKHTMIIPPIGRLQSELFNGLISRSIAILGRAGKLRGILAPELIDQGYEIQYISKLALALRIIETRSITATMEVINPFGEINPQIFDNYDFDEIARGVGERMGVPPNWMNPPPKVDDIREQRAADEAEIKAAELAAGAADAIPKLQKETEAGSPLEAMAEAVG